MINEGNSSVDMAQDPNTSVSDTTAETQIGDQGSDDGLDLSAKHERLKQQYDGSTKEALRLREDNQRLIAEKQKLSQFAEIGQGFVMRYENDPRFKEVVDSVFQKKATGESLNKEEQKVSDQMGNQQSDSFSVPKEDYEFIQNLKQRENLEKSEREKRFLSMISEIEGDDASEIDKFNIQYYDPREQRSKIQNPVRNAIGATAQMYISQGMGEREAYALAHTIHRKPEILQEKGKLEGMMKALETRQVSSSFTQSKGVGDEDDSTNVSQQEMELIRTSKFKADPNILKGIKERDAKLAKMQRK